jgi:tetratricopeptide (TPR) repeat protein
MKQKWILITLVIFALTACTSPSHEAMRQRLKYVSDCNRADTVFTERWLPTVDSLVAYFDRHGSANDRMMAHYVQGRVHHDMGEAPQALECYQKAAELADTTSSDCDLYTLYAVYGQMSVLFHSQFLPDDEMQSLQMSEWIARKNSDTIAAIKAYELRIRPYSLKGEKDSMLFIMKNARKQYLLVKDTAHAATAIYAAISIFLDRHNYLEAKQLLDIYEKESSNFDKDGKLIKGELYYYDKGRYLLGVGQTQEAKKSFEKIIDSGLNEARFRGLLSVYEKLGNSDSIAKYAKLFAAANDSSFLHVNQQQVEQVRANYNYHRQQQMAEKRKQEARNWMIGVIGTVMAALLFIAILLIVFYRFKAKRLQEIGNLMGKKENLEQLLAEKEASSEEIRKEIVRLNNKNSSNSKIHKENISRLQAQIETLQQKLLDNIQTAEVDPRFENLIVDFKNRLQEYHRGDKPPTELEWAQLKKAFSYNHRSGYLLVTSPRNMTEEQIRVCMMTMLGISESMMAFALDSDNRRVDRVKRQANKKLFGEDNARTLKSNLRLYYP